MNMTEATYRTSSAWGDVTRGTRRFDLLGLALFCLTSAITISTILFRV